MDYLPLLYARAARSGGPCVPFWGPDLRRQVAICSGVKEGRVGAAGSPRGEVPVVLMGRVYAGVCGIQLLDLDARNLDFACLGNCLRHAIGKLDGVEERLGFFLMQIEVRDEDVDASRLNVGKEEG